MFQISCSALQLDPLLFQIITKKLIIQHQSIKASNAKNFILFYFLNSWDDYKSDLISCDSDWSVRDLPTIW